MSETPNQRIVRHFIDLFQLKVTGTIFKKELGIARSLLGAGFSEEEIILTLDYLKKYPPAKGLTSLAYLQYVINDVLPKAKVMKMHEVQNVFDVKEEDNSDNLSKFNRFNTNNKLKI